jgi:hypothetical protein
MLYALLSGFYADAVILILAADHQEFTTAKVAKNKKWYENFTFFAIFAVKFLVNTSNRMACQHLLSINQNTSE